MADPSSSCAALEPSDVEAALDTVRRFVRTEVGRAGPEHPVTPVEVEVLVEGARQIGLISDQDVSGLGLWDSPTDPLAFRLYSSALIALGEGSAGIGWHLHQLALGSALCRELKIDDGAPTVAVLHGRSSFGRGALASLLGGHESARPALLAECFPLSAGSCLFQAAEGWRRLLVPRLDDGATLGWSVYEREELTLEPLAENHGLEETLTWRWSTAAATPAPAVEVEPGESMRIFTVGLGLHALAAMALGLGSARSALERARRYAAERTQAGATLDRHAAVQLMLGRIEAHIEAVSAMVERVDQPPVTLDELLAVLSQRAVARAPEDPL